MVIFVKSCHTLILTVFSGNLKTLSTHFLKNVIVFMFSEVLNTSHLTFYEACLCLQDTSIIHL